MADEPIHQPHDKLFAIGFSDPVHAAALLQTQVPADLAPHIDWSALKQLSGSFVDPNFGRAHTDLLFSTTFRDRECRIYVLFEHQSSRDARMALRLLHYMVKIWWDFDLKNPPSKPLPVILPVVLAQNATTWELSCQFSGLVDVPAGLESMVRPFVPDFQFRLLQLADQPFEALPGTPLGKLILRVMKAERDDSGQGLLSDWVWDEVLLASITLEQFAILVRYILNADIDKQSVMMRLQRIKHQSTRNKAMSVAQQLRQEGRQEGHQEGRQEGASSTVLRQLRRKFPVVYERVEPLVLACDEERLMSFGEALLFMQSPEDCLAWFAEE